MTDIRKIAKQVSEDLGIDVEIVEKVCRFPFLFTEDVMKDDTDTHSILFNKLFTFKLKSRFIEDKTKPYR